MAVQKYPGRVLSKTPPTITPPVDGEGGSAPGVWTLSEALENEKAGTWPKPVLPRELYTWGTGQDGQIGNSSIINRSSPVQIGSLTTWAQVSGGSACTASVKTDGTLWVWGNNVDGNLGLNDRTYRSSPVQVGALTNWSQVEGTDDKKMAAIKTDGTLWTWGDGGFGQLGHNDTTFRSSPVQVGSDTNWYRVSGGFRFMTAVKTDGTLWAWGWGGNGRLGLNENPVIDHSSPTQVGALTNWAEVSSASHTAAIKTDGTLWTWGQDSNQGRLGINNGNDVSSPTQVGSLTNWSKPATNLGTLVVKTDGTLWAFGLNSSGESGVDNTINYSSPVQVGGDTNWAQPSFGFQFSTAVKTDGTLWTWGGGSTGKLGQNNTINYSSPVQVGALTTWSQVSAGNNFMVAITKG